MSKFAMLASEFDEKRIKEWPVVVEPKLDGFRLLAHVTSVGVRFMSRSGKPFPALAHLEGPLHKAIRKIYKQPLLLDGEVLSGKFNETSSSVRKKTEQATDAVFHVFDAMPLEDWEHNKVNDAYVDRRAFLRSLAPHLPEQVRVLDNAIQARTVEQIMEAYGQFRDQGFEGAIVKLPLSPYERKRSFHWMKIKALDSVDVKIIDAFIGTGKYAKCMGGLVVDHKGVQVNVGTGFTDEQRRDFWSVRQALIGRLIEVSYQEVTPAGSLRHPRFVRFRDALTGAKE